MGNGYNHHFHYQQQNLNNFQKTTFLPLLCSRTAIKDVTLPRLEERSASFNNDPLSPKIGCMGQVKRNNKIIGFPAATFHSKLALTSKGSNDDKYFKLKRLFSGRNLGSNNASCAVNSCRRREGTGNNNSVSSKSNKEVCVNIAEMDPPLPVIKRVAKPADELGGEGKGNNLWKRRSGGGALKSLELQQIKIPRHQVEINTV